MRNLVAVLVVLLAQVNVVFAAEASSWHTRPALELAAAAVDGRNEEFQAHADYVAMVTPYAPTRELLKQLEARLAPKKLLNRGESHVTVITPPEYAVLAKVLKQDDIDQVVRARSVQAAKLEALCVGSGRALVDGREEETFYVVVRSPALVRIREDLARVFREKGGEARAFDAAHYYPHITLGFTKTDLHESQGVVKSEKSCRFPLVIK